MGRVTIKHCSSDVRYSSCNVRTNDVTDVYEFKDILMSNQIGSNEKPVLMTNKKNGGRMGKGSRSRPLTVSKEEFDNNWDKIFNK